MNTLSKLLYTNRSYLNAIASQVKKRIFNLNYITKTLQVIERKLHLNKTKIKDI
jgi:hypothetical protein